MDKWTKYYLNLNSVMQPNEYLLKLLLGNYKGKKNFLLGKANSQRPFDKLKCLDSSCGDGRNIPLLLKLGFNVFGTEISDQICEKAQNNIRSLGVKLPKANLKKAFNNSLPFKNEFFDFLISWNAIYYLNDEEQEISENFDEVSRVLKKGSYFIASVPGPKCFSILGAKKFSRSKAFINLQDKSNWSRILNKTAIHLFENKDSLANLLEKKFTNISISELNWDGFGTSPLHYFLFVAQKKT
jgi:SAM-dependent methyltransferase